MFGEWMTIRAQPINLRARKQLRSRGASRKSDRRTSGHISCYYVHPGSPSYQPRLIRNGERKMKLRTLILACTILALGSAVFGHQAAQPSAAATERITREVRHELLMLPYFGVFDNIAYKVDGYNVTLLGQVSRPSLKSD